MRLGYPQPDVPQLRLGLHVFVVALAVAVLLRAVLLDEVAAGATALLVALFISLYVVLARASSPAWRRLLVVALVGVWVGLVLIGADAAYVSVGLFLVFLTEFDLVPALIGVVAVTAFDASLGIAQEGSVETLLGPLLGAMLSVLLGIGYRVLFEATSSQRMLIDELRRTRAELAESERAAGQATERQRLAREIHDTVAQGLSSIQLLLHAAEAEQLPPAVRGRLALARETAGSSLNEARRMVAELAPADLADASLSSALQRVCERAVIDVRFLVDGEPASLPMPVEAALVRIAQSALANVEQHAGPQARAVVTLSRSGGRVRLDVVDDGQGFDTAILGSAEAPTFGLDTIRSRVAELGGEFTLESEAGHTALAVSFPVEAEGSA